MSLQRGETAAVPIGLSINHLHKTGERVCHWWLIGVWGWRIQDPQVLLNVLVLQEEGLGDGYSIIRGPVHEHGLRHGGCERNQTEGEHPQELSRTEQNTTWRSSEKQSRLLSVKDMGILKI
jgi:hypothetical protein